MQAAATKLTGGLNNSRGGWVDSSSSSLSSKSTASLFNRLLRTVTGGNNKSSSKQNSSGEFPLVKRSDISNQLSIEDNWVLVNNNQISGISAQRENSSLNVSNKALSCVKINNFLNNSRLVDLDFEVGIDCKRRATNG